MTVHLIKLSVGVESFEHLQRIQDGRRAAARERGEPPVARHLTRSTPRRAEEVLDGGSIYWVIRGVIQARQRVIGLESATNPEGLPRCAIVLGEPLVRTVPRHCRPFQGWRYLRPEDAPPDLGSAEELAETMPPEMLAELKELGLI